MADSLREAIVARVVTLLKTIREADGYETTPVDVSRKLRPLGEQGPGRMPVLYVGPGVEAREVAPCEQVDNEFTVHIWGYALDESETTEYLERLLRDVKKVLQATAAFGVAAKESGQAVMTSALITHVEMGMTEETPYGAFRADLRVTYREPLVLS